MTSKWCFCLSKTVRLLWSIPSSQEGPVELFLLCILRGQKEPLKRAIKLELRAWNQSKSVETVVFYYLGYVSHLWQGIHRCALCHELFNEEVRIGPLAPVITADSQTESKIKIKKTRLVNFFQSILARLDVNDCQPEIWQVCLRFWCEVFQVLLLWQLCPLRMRSGKWRTKGASRDSFAAILGGMNVL